MGSRIDGTNPANLVDGLANKHKIEWNSSWARWATTRARWATS